MPDYNGMNIPLMKAGMDRYQLFDILDEMRLLNVKVLEAHGETMDPEVRERLQLHCDVLKPILNPVYRPKGIESDPFVPRYCADKIEYFANELGYAIIVSENGVRTLKPRIVPNCGREAAGEVFGEIGEILDADDPRALDKKALQSEAFAEASCIAEKWELPQREPHFVEAPHLNEMIRTSISQEIALRSASGPKI